MQLRQPSSMMKQTSILLVGLMGVAGVAPRTSNAQTFSSEVAPLLEASCVGCHAAGTETPLDFDALGHDLSNAETFRKWERVFDRVAVGDMPPKSEERPDPVQVTNATNSLKRDLQSANAMRQQRVGRVPARRLTKLEFGYTLRDLLSIEGDVTSGMPDEVEAASFDTVGATQRISSVHIESYLKAVDQALQQAIRLGANPYRVSANNFSHLEEWHEKPLSLGGSVTRGLLFGSGVVLFADVDYLTQFQFRVTTPGIHRITAKVAAYQSTDAVTAKFVVKDQSGAARLVKAVDLLPDAPQMVVVDTFLSPGETPYLTLDAKSSDSNSVFAAGGAQNYKGKGLAIMSQRIEGPLLDSWPPPSTLQLLVGLELAAAQGSDAGPFEVRMSKTSLEHVTEIVNAFAPRAFRRTVSADEQEAFISLAQQAIDEGRDLIDALSISLRAMLSSPQFLLFDGEPGPLTDHALANRLSYCLWRSMPDDQLFALANQGMLSDPAVLMQQVDRMLADEKSLRFVKDFVGQWLRLHKVNVTIPDAGLYPEFDELLGDAIPQETELFFASLIEDNLSLSNLVDADYTFLNRRLAEHYGIPGVEGQEFRKVALPADGVRGGLLTQAAILKTTANGTTTSPVTRGNFVLTNLLGTPPSPPPPGIGSIEPDTRGQTTIREILAAHRHTETCSQCHREIDPPGFALESFDPIGGFRTYYRVSGGEQKLGDFTVTLPPRQGPPVDPSGVTSNGKSFSGIEEFKRHLLDQEEQLARNFISQLVVYATGGEIQFADRQEVEAILNRTRDHDFPIRDMIHQVVQSTMFKNK